MKKTAEAPVTGGGTADRILDLAEQLAQTRGFNGFSYADISEALGITKASLHYHFRTKAELGRSLMERYRTNFTAALEAIDATGVPAADKLEPYAKLYAQVLHGERMCLCGMLAAEYSTLAPPIQDEVRRFFDLNEAWLAGVLRAGREEGGLRFTGTPEEMARVLLGGLEGAMLVARSYGDPARFDEAAGRITADLTVPPASK
ncbi:MAG: TetR/AcrR family transcriptional regulator [Tepidiformaceae bacterium]